MVFWQEAAGEARTTPATVALQPAFVSFPGSQMCSGEFPSWESSFRRVKGSKVQDLWDEQEEGWISDCLHAFRFSLHFWFAWRPVALTASMHRVISTHSGKCDSNNAADANFTKKKPTVAPTTGTASGSTSSFIVPGTGAKIERRASRRKLLGPKHSKEILHLPHTSVRKVALFYR